MLPMVTKSLQSGYNRKFNTTTLSAFAETELRLNMSGCHCSNPRFCFSRFCSIPRFFCCFRLLGHSKPSEHGEGENISAENKFDKEP